jgi:hypothetical protein
MVAMLLFTFAAVASGIQLSAEGSPTERVITLLEDLRNQVQEEGAAEAETYDKFACFCKDKSNAKVDSIATRESDIATLTADLEQLKAEKVELKADIKKLNEDLATYEADLKKMTEIRDQEHAVYETEHADATAAVSALSSAIGHIEGSKSLLEVKAQVQKSLQLADALSIPVKNSQTITAFLQQPESMEVPEEDYSFHSGGIIDTLNGLLKEFEERLATLEKEEEAAQASFDEAAKSKREEIETAKSTLETREEQLADNESTTAEKEEMLTEETALLHDDRAYLKDVTGQCEERAKEWDQRTTARAGELEAVSKALEILGGTVLEKEKSSCAGGRTEAEPALVEEAPAKLAVTTMVQVDGDSNDEYHDVVFVQEKAVHKHGSNAQVELRNRAITILSAAAQHLKSGPIALLTMKMAADPFAKVKGLIQGLIERLLKEAANEATHKGWCDTEIGKAEKDREYRHGDMETLNAEITTLRALKAKLEEERDTLTEEILQLENDLNEATEVRNEDKANNKKTLGDAGEGLEALKEAIKVLNDFYRKAGRNKVLLQASPVDQDMGGEGVDGSAKGAYKGNQAQGAGIIGMLETIKSDFERTVKTTEEEEYKASREFAAFSQESKVSISSKSTGLKNTNNELELTNSNLVAALNDLKETQKLLDSSLEQLEKLRPACVDTGMSYEERVARREAEIEALKKALCVLDEEDGEIPECAGKFFLQKSKA